MAGSRSRVVAGVLFVSVAGLLAAGCSPGSVLSSAPTAQLFNRDGTDVLSEPAARNTSFFKDTTSTERVCRAPAPDFATTDSAGFNLGVGLPVGGAKDVGEDAGKGALGLGGRDPEVLIVRELMYRACELSLNLNANQKTTLKIYDRFLRVIEKLGKTQTGAGSKGAAATAPDIQGTTGSQNDNNNNDNNNNDNGSDSSGDSGFY